MAAGLRSYSSSMFSYAYFVQADSAGEEYSKDFHTAWELKKVIHQ